MDYMYQLTIDEKSQLEGVTYDGVTFFNPVKDINGTWFISKIEVDGCTHSEGIEWIHDLPYVEYTAPPDPINLYYIKFNSEDNILKIYTYNLYPKPFRVLNINSLSESEQVIMDTLRSLVSSDYLGFTMIEFIREDSLIKIHTLSEGIVSLPMADMSASDVIAYEAVGTICNELVEIL